MPATPRIHGPRRLAPVLAVCALAAPAVTAAAASAEPLRDSGPGLRATPAPAPVPGPARGKGLVRPTEPATSGASTSPDRDDGDGVDWGLAAVLGAGTAAALAVGLSQVRGGRVSTRQPAG